MTRTLRSLAGTLALAMVGCAPLGIQIRTGGAGASGDATTTGSAQTGLPPGCTKEITWLVVHPDEPLTDQITVAACAARDRYPALDSDIKGAVALHRHFDDRHTSPIVAALIAIEYHVNLPHERSEKGFLLKPVATATLAWYADQYDEASLRAALARVSDLPAKLADAFVARAMAAKPVIAERVSHLDARLQRLLLEPATRVHKERVAYFAANAALYTRLEEAMRAKKGTELADELVRLRGEYFATHKDAQSRYEPFVLDVTREIVRASLQAKDNARATIEAHLLDEEDALKGGYAYSIWAAQMLEVAKENAAAEKHASEKAANMETGPSTAIATNINEEPWYPSDDALDNRKKVTVTIPGYAAFDMKRGDVRRVERKGDRAKIIFSDIVTRSEVQDCHDTNRVAGFTTGTGGQVLVRYEQSCRSAGMQTDHIKTDPLVVPAQEAAQLAPGDHVIGLVEGKSGIGGVLTAERKGKWIQFRSHPVTGTAPPRENR